MKRILIILFTITAVTSCSKNEDSDENDQILGEWKLIRANFYGDQGNNSIDYTSDKIIYKFQSNGILIITGGENVGYPDGEHNYTFGKDYLDGSTNDEKIFIVKIETTKFIYDFDNGEMTLGQSFVDGPDLVFTKI